MSNTPSGIRHSIGGFQIALLAFTVIVLSALVVDTAVILPKEVSNLIHMIDTFACAVFFGDLCYRFYHAKSRVGFMKWGWIDLLACIPNLEILRWGRLVRVLRVIRLLRGVR
jgi:voltage-gated potassium channel